MNYQLMKWTVLFGLVMIMINGSHASAANRAAFSNHAGTAITTHLILLSCDSE